MRAGKKRKHRIQRDGKIISPTMDSLKRAIQANDLELVIELIEAPRGNFQLRDMDNYAALHEATKHGQVKIIEFLMTAAPKSDSLSKLLRTACAHRQLEAFKSLLGNTSTFDHQHEYALHLVQAELFVDNNEDLIPFARILYFEMCAVVKGSSFCLPNLAPSHLGAYYRNPTQVLEAVRQGQLDTKDLQLLAESAAHHQLDQAKMLADLLESAQKIQMEHPYQVTDPNPSESRTNKKEAFKTALEQFDINKLKELLFGPQGDITFASAFNNALHAMIKNDQTEIVQLLCELPTTYCGYVKFAELGGNLTTDDSEALALAYKKNDIKYFEAIIKSPSIKNIYSSNTILRLGKNLLGNPNKKWAELFFNEALQGLSNNWTLTVVNPRNGAIYNSEQDIIEALKYRQLSTKRLSRMIEHAEANIENVVTSKLNRLKNALETYRQSQRENKKTESEQADPPPLTTQYQSQRRRKKDRKERTTESHKPRKRNRKVPA